MSSYMDVMQLAISCSQNMSLFVYYSINTNSSEHFKANNLLAAEFSLWDSCDSGLSEGTN